MIDRLIMVREMAGSYVSMCGRFGIWQREERTWIQCRRGKNITRIHGRWFARDLEKDRTIGEDGFRTYDEAFKKLLEYVKYRVDSGPSVEPGNHDQGSQDA